MDRLLRAADGIKVLRAPIEENSLFLNISITAKMTMTTLESWESYKFRILFSFNEEKPLAPPPPISFSFILELTCSFSTFERGIFDHAIVINDICTHKVGFVSKFMCCAWPWTRLSPVLQF